jgi:hypothetical protein
MKNKKLVVLDYITNEIYVYDYDENIWECPEDYEIDGVFVIHNNCNWLVVNELKINIL